MFEPDWAIQFTSALSFHYKVNWSKCPNHKSELVSHLKIYSLVANIKMIW